MTPPSLPELAELRRASVGCATQVSTPMPTPESAQDPIPLMQGLLDGMLDAAWLVDATSLRVVAANPAAGTLLGIDAAALREKEVLELSATPEDMIFWGEVAAGLDHGIESKTLMRRFDGSTVPVVRRVSPVQSAPDRRWFIVVAHDLSERCRVEGDLEQRVAELSATFESIGDAILVTDLAGNIRSFNHSFAVLWGLPEAMLTHRDDDDVLAWMRRSVVDPANYMRRLASIDEASLVRATDMLTLQCGKLVERVASPQCSRGQLIGRVYSFRDMTTAATPSL